LNDKSTETFGVQGLCYSALTGDLNGEWLQ